MSKFDLTAEKPHPSHFQPRLDDLNVFDAWSSWNGYKLADYFYDPEFEYFSVRNIRRDIRKDIRNDILEKFATE